MPQNLIPVSINGVEFDALMTEELTLPATIPQYVVEEGFEVSDTIILNARKLSMTLIVTSTPVTWIKTHGGGVSHVATVIAQLQALYFSREPVTVVTPNGTYSNMGIESISITKSPDGIYDREVSISLAEVRKTRAGASTLPAGYGKGGASSAMVGTANTTTTTSGSILWNLLNGLGVWGGGS